MIKKLLFIGLIILIPLILVQKPVEAKSELPEKNGLYPVKGHPELKLRVFVHPPRGDRGGKPTPMPTPTPILNCKLNDPPSETTDAITGWYLPSPFTYYLNPNSVPNFVGSQNIDIIAGKGFQEWTTAIDGKVTINKVGETSKNRARLDGANIISWGKASPGTLGITYIWYYNNGRVAEVDTIMNQQYPWSWSNSPVCAYTESYDAQNILTHELGHWLGVDDNYGQLFEDNTMYGWGETEETKKDTLTAGDITAVNQIYP